MQTEIVQDGLKFYLEKRQIDIATYKIERIDVTPYFKDAYFKRASKAANTKYFTAKAVEVMQRLAKAFTALAVPLAEAAKNITKAFEGLKK